MSSATAQAALDLLKALAILSNTIARRSAVDREDLKATFLLVINNPIIYKFFKDFTNHRKKTNRAVVLCCRPFPNFLKYRVAVETFQQSRKQDSFSYLLRWRYLSQKIYLSPLD